MTICRRLLENYVTLGKNRKFDEAKRRRDKGETETSYTQTGLNWKIILLRKPLVANDSRVLYF